MLDTLFIPYGTTKQSKKIEIYSANGSPLNCLGLVNLCVFFEGQATYINALVTNELQENFLISWKDLQRMKIIPSTFPYTMRKSKRTSTLQISAENLDLDTLLSEFSDVFNEESVTPMVGDPMHIHKTRMGTVLYVSILLGKPQNTSNKKLIK